MLRSLEAVNTGPIGSVGDEQAGFLPLVIISTTVILLNFGLGFAVANLIRKFQQVEEL
jgi:sulfite exporter TauE/SafE